MYQTTVHRGEQKFAPVERVEQLEVSKEEGREGAPTSRDPGRGRVSGRSRKKKSNFAGFSGPNSRKKRPISREFSRSLLLKNDW